MLHTPLCRSIRKGDNSILFKGAALDFKIFNPSVRLSYLEIEAAIVKGHFSPDFRAEGEKGPALQILLHSLVWGLGVHIDEKRRKIFSLLLHSNKVKKGGAGGILSSLQIDFASWNEKLPAAPCILHMALHFPSFH